MEFFSSPRPSAITSDQDIEQLIGNTPVARLRRMASGGNEVLLKLEGTNPGGSVKDRAALQMILAAERQELIKPGDTLVEATSGNTGIALAMVAAARGYRMKLIMPANQSEERKQSMRAYGAELILVSKDEGMEGARDLADQMHADGKALKLDQFANQANPLGHVLGTGPELWEQTGGRITHFVSAMGTTGTISGCASYFKEKRRAAVEIIGCQPAPGASIPGIRKWPEEYVPKILRADLIDRYIEISQQDAEDTTRALAAREGIAAGVSSGGALWAALQVDREVSGKTIVVIICDRADRYLSTGVFG